MFIDNQQFQAKRGDILLDAALVNGVDIPHDCRSGHCGTCQVRILKGFALGGDAGNDGTVRACQARVITDLDVLVEPVPDVVTTRGMITGLRPVAPDVVELRISVAKPVTYLPGQYYRFRFQGFPARCFSPTEPMMAERTAQNENAIRLHIRRIPGGKVSSALGVSINRGHPVKLQGPYGNAYLRADQRGRLVLVSSGTGFAPIWSIARAALRENPQRRIVMVIGSKGYQSLYMRPAARWLKEQPHVLLIPVVDKLPEGATSTIRIGRPTDHMPALRASDTVYACGAPIMVEAVRTRAANAGAMFYADPFVAQADELYDGFFSWAMDRITNMLPAPGRLSLPSPLLRLERPR